jgi:hypothetical protein
METVGVIAVNGDEMRVEEIDDFPLSHVLTYFDCAECRVVDRALERGVVGHPCGRCGRPSSGGHHYFPFSVPVLIDLIQHHYHLPEQTVTDSVLVAPDAHRLSVVVFFCSLVEVLLQHFLVVGQRAKDVPMGTIRNTLRQTQYVAPRLKKLFPLVAGRSWKDALKELPKVDGRSATEVAVFCRRAAVARNHFLHAGNRWAIPAPMPLECVQHLPGVLELFVALHNQYVAMSLS